MEIMVIAGLRSKVNSIDEFILAVNQVDSKPILGKLSKPNPHFGSAH